MSPSQIIIEAYIYYISADYTDSVDLLVIKP